MRSRKLVLRKIGEALGLLLVEPHQNQPNMVLSKLHTAITFGLAVGIGQIAYGLGVEK